MSAVRFALVREGSGERICVLEDLEGFFSGHTDLYAEFEAEELPEGPEPITFTTLGPPQCGPGDWGNVELEVLDVSGRRIGAYWVGDAEAEAAPDGSGGLVVSGWVNEVPDAGAGAVWETWRNGPPSRYGQWTRLPAGGTREGWLEVVLRHEPSSPRATSGGAAGPVTMDGTHITDLAGFFLALGEAISGPGGYAGANFMAMSECLREEVAKRGELHVLWTHAEIAEQHLTRTAPTVSGVSTYLDIALSVFRDAGVRVDLVPGS